MAGLSRLKSHMAPTLAQVVVSRGGLAETDVGPPTLAIPSLADFGRPCLAHFGQIGGHRLGTWAQSSEWSRWRERCGLGGSGPAEKWRRSSVEWSSVQNYFFCLPPDAPLLLSFLQNCGGVSSKAALQIACLEPIDRRNGSKVPSADVENDVSLHQKFDYGI